MSDSQIYVILLFVNALCGAGDIYFAIHHFKKKQYFCFGWWVMFAISAVVQMIDVIICV